MSLILHYHPLSSYCWKALIALYENETPFEANLLNPGDPAGRAALDALWPLGKMPVLEDTARGRVIGEASLVVEYLDIHHPGPVRFLPDDRDAALEARLADRLFDNYVHAAMQRVVNNRIRPPADRSDYEETAGRDQLARGFDLAEGWMAGREWAANGRFGLADLAAFPPLFYGQRLVPIDASRPSLAGYMQRLMARPSVARALKEAEPYFHMLPI